MHVDQRGLCEPRWFEEIGCRGVLRAAPGDFRVKEKLDFDPSGDGEHLLLYVEKCGANTHYVAEELARCFEVDKVDVGFAGRKDRHAVTRQWFSVHTPIQPSEVRDVAGDQWRVLKSTRHARKLRPGQLQGNQFRLCLRAVAGDREKIDARLDSLHNQAVPNYFGPQRFGHDRSNIGRAWAWLATPRRQRVNAFTKGLHLSVARAHLFNAVVTARVSARNFAQPLPGDVLIEGAPTAPLWGRGHSATQGSALAIEQAALAPLREWLEPLEHVGLSQERRALVMRAVDLSWTWPAEDEIVLEFFLPRGQYATSLIRELGEFQEPG